MTVQYLFKAKFEQFYQAKFIAKKVANKYSH